MIVSERLALKICLKILFRRNLGRGMKKRKKKKRGRKKKKRGRKMRRRRLMKRKLITKRLKNLQAHLRNQ